jgi:hypothetical protein
VDLLQWGSASAEFLPSGILSEILDGEDPLVGADKLCAKLSDFSLGKVTVPDE